MTKAIYSKGWLHTEDIEAILTYHGNALKIIDRVKNIFNLQMRQYRGKTLELLKKIDENFIKLLDDPEANQLCFSILGEFCT